MFRGLPAQDAITATMHGHMLASRAELAAANIELVDMEDRERILKRCLAPVKSKYQYIILDCPPSLELLTLNALTAADTVLIPVQTEFYALEGLSDLIGTIRLVKQKMNPSLDIEGLVLTMYDKRTKLSADVEDTLKKHFPGKVYDTVIPRNIRLSEAPSHGKPCIAYDKSSKGTKAYLHVASELLKRQKAVEN